MKRDHRDKSWTELSSEERTEITREGYENDHRWGEVRTLNAQGQHTPARELADKIQRDWYQK